jgi:hypothetical protein
MFISADARESARPDCFAVHRHRRDRHGDLRLAGTGVQGNAHAINEAGSLRMQSYRLLASVPLTQDDRPLIDEMERTAFSPELENAAIRAGQQSQLKALQGYWHTQLEPGLKQARSTEPLRRTWRGLSHALMRWSPRSTRPPNYASTGW